nr:hypothetical protein [Escherichia coli]
MGRRRWKGLPDDVRETITVHFTAKRGDWCDIWGSEDVSVWWNRLCDNVVPEKTMPFDLLTVLPEVTGVASGVTRMYRCGGTVCVTTYCRKKPCRLTC